jgi:hypothetical protein
MTNGTGRARRIPRDQTVADLRAAVRWEAADLETVEATLGRLSSCDPDLWVMEWTAAAGALWSRPDPARPGASYLAASSYYAAALAMIDGTDGSVSEPQLWRRQRDCWNLASQLLGAERVGIPFERAVLPAYFFNAGPGRRPLIVIDHGGRVATSYAWVQGGAAALEHGFHWLTFDGPGRQSARRDLGLTLRPDWEAVVRAVLDMAVARLPIDHKRVALLGSDHGAFGVARALTHEYRCVAAAVLPGIVDASQPVVTDLPVAAHEALLAREREAFDTELRLAELFAPGTTEQLRRLTRDYGGLDHRLYDVNSRILEFRLDRDRTRSIETPLGVASDRDNGVWAGQAEQLCDRVESAEPIGQLDLGAATAIDWIAAHF